MAFGISRCNSSHTGMAIAEENKDNSVVSRIGGVVVFILPASKLNTMHANRD